MGKIRITLDSVHCGNTEDVTGADEFYLLGAVVTDDPNQCKGVLTTPISINDDQTKGFRPEEAVLFEGDLPDNQSVGLMLQAYDEDVAKDWSKRSKLVDVITTAVSAELGKEAGAAVGVIVAGGPVNWGIIAASLIASLALGGFYLGMGSDKDDQLGTTNLVIPVTGPANEYKSWSFSHHSSNPFTDWYSDWDYTVAYRIHREGTNVVVPPPRPKPPERPPRHPYRPGYPVEP